MTIRKILVPLSGQFDPADPEGLEKPALETAFIVGRRLKAHVEVFCIEAQPHEAHSHLAPWVPGLAIEDLLNTIEDESDKRRKRTRALFEAVADHFEAVRRSAPDPEGDFSVNFLEETGYTGGLLPLRGRLADLIVTACPALQQDGGVPKLLEVALRETGRPVLISREAASDTFGARIAIAWNGSAEAPDDELLLVDWLNAPVYEMATRMMLFSRFGVCIQGDTLRGEAWGEQIDATRHRPASEIKVASEDGRWVAQCAVDL